MAGQSTSKIFTLKTNVLLATGRIRWKNLWKFSTVTACFTMLDKTITSHDPYVSFYWVHASPRALVHHSHSHSRWTGISKKYGRRIKWSSDHTISQHNAGILNYSGVILAFQLARFEEFIGESSQKIYLINAASRIFNAHRNTWRQIKHALRVRRSNIVRPEIVQAMRSFITNRDAIDMGPSMAPRRQMPVTRVSKCPNSEKH